MIFNKHSEYSSQMKVLSVFAEVFLGALFSLPWLIAYFVIFDDVDATECTGIPYQFGEFARYAYLAAAIVSCVIIPIMHLWHAIEKTQWPHWIRKAEHAFLFGVWLYAVIALAHRGDCQATSYIRLIWATVLFPIVAGLLVCCCLGIFTKGGAGGYREIKQDPFEEKI